MHELIHLISKAGTLSEAEVMLIVLGSSTLVMIANLLIMVIVGGYETFVSRLDLDGPRINRNGCPTSMPASSRSNWPRVDRHFVHPPAETFINAPRSKTGSS